jgi:uncharacterized protein DUF4079
MQFPLISRELISILKLVHGGYNLSVMLLFFYHARNGLMIRRARTGNTPLPFQEIKRHRRMGPVLALLGAGGFSAGVGLVLLDTGNIFEHPAHLFVGTAIVSLLLLTYRISRKIAGPSSLERDLHYRLGLAILALYLVNVVLGIGVLL